MFNLSLGIYDRIYYEEKITKKKSVVQPIFDKSNFCCKKEYLHF